MQRNLQILASRKFRRHLWQSPSLSPSFQRLRLTAPPQSWSRRSPRWVGQRPNILVPWPNGKYPAVPHPSRYGPLVPPERFAAHAGCGCTKLLPSFTAPRGEMENRIKEQQVCACSPDPEPVYQRCEPIQLNCGCGFSSAGPKFLEPASMRPEEGSQGTRRGWKKPRCEQNDSTQRLLQDRRRFVRRPKRAASRWFLRWPKACPYQQVPFSRRKPSKSPGAAWILPPCSPCSRVAEVFISNLRISSHPGKAETEPAQRAKKKNNEKPPIPTTSGLTTVPEPTPSNALPLENLPGPVGRPAPPAPASPSKKPERGGEMRARPRRQTFEPSKAQNQSSLLQFLEADHPPARPYPAAGKV